MSADPAGMPDPRPSVLVLYHYLHPDDVVSARHFGDLCRGLMERGWKVEAMPCNRSCHRSGTRYPRREDWGGVMIRRVWRPDIPQHSGLGRIFNAAWMLAAWSSGFLRRRGSTPDIVIFGTDPVLSAMVAVPIKLRSPQVSCVQWSFDLYPEAPIADGLLNPGSIVARILRRAVAAGLRKCDCIVDIGSCMRRRLASYPAAKSLETIPPWALVEPASPPECDPDVRESLFGQCKLGLLYSGNLGRPHGFESILRLARVLRDGGIRFCFSVRGSRLAELEASLDEGDGNVRVVDFAPESRLETQLAAADVHLVSLRDDWVGIVVPSKFFGCLAAGRPVVYAGDSSSAIGQWIAELGVGWVLNGGTLDRVATELSALADDPVRLRAMQAHCHRTYQERFSRERALDRWDHLLRSLAH